jgi:class 3 adenylate cyclase
VNLAARLEAHTKEIGRLILIDEDTRTGLNGDIPVQPEGEIVLKGKSNPVNVYSVA